MDEEYARLFTNMVTGPLEKVVGKSLISVVYYVLNTDLSGFDANTANTSGGCQGIHLTFEGGEVELDWGWQHAFRPSNEDNLSPPIAYHLVARVESERRRAVRAHTADDIVGLTAVDATTSIPWDQANREPLLSVTVWGVALPASRYSPQAVVFEFPCGQIVVSIGMTTPLSIGDGDEVMVFSGHEWAQSFDSIPQDFLIPTWWSPDEKGLSSG
jgi:hypothetical protein